MGRQQSSRVGQDGRSDGVTVGQTLSAGSVGAASQWHHLRARLGGTAAGESMRLPMLPMLFCCRA